MKACIINVDTRSTGFAALLTNAGELRCCPRCESQELFALEKERAEFNICIQCRGCGHVFSPRS